jgi:hypothetical protein
MELGEKFAWFILDPGLERLQLEEQNTEDIMSTINNILQEQATKFHNFLQVLNEKKKLEEINGLTIIQFFESGANILREKEEIMNSLNFLANNYERYQYEINTKNTKSN